MISLSGSEVAAGMKEMFGDSITGFDDDSISVASDKWLEVASYLREKMDFNYLCDLTAVDYKDHLDVLYRLFSLERVQSLVVRVGCKEVERPEVCSVTGLWRGADFMEREVYDLMGVNFVGHPSLRRIFLWDGFPGHPLRKDFGL